MRYATSLAFLNEANCDRALTKIKFNEYGDEKEEVSGGVLIKFALNWLLFPSHVIFKFKFWINVNTVIFVQNSNAFKFILYYKHKNDLNSKQF